MLDEIKDAFAVTALKLAAFFQAMSDNYREVLEANVFQKTIIKGKEGLKLRKMLCNKAAHTVLDLGWKE